MRVSGLPRRFSRCRCGTKNKPRTRCRIFPWFSHGKRAFLGHFGSLSFLFGAFRARADHRSNRWKRLAFSGFLVVLPVGIEPTTSPLPRECSTTELRQRPAPMRAEAITRGPLGWQGRRPGPRGCDPARPKGARPTMARRPGEQRRVGGPCGRDRRGARFRCSRSLVAERFSLIPKAEFVFPRLRKLIPNRLIRCAILKHASDISGCARDFRCFCPLPAAREIGHADPPTP